MDRVLSIEQLKQMYFDMVQIRRFEEKVEEYSKSGEIPGFVHLGIGQEAVQVGSVLALRPTDYKFPDHRCHGAIFLFGTDKKAVMAEIFGKATGINGGRGGSMHISDLSVRNMGNNGIQGSNVVTALGPAFYSQYKKQDDVTAVFMGDGTLGEGACHESLNLAAMLEAPAGVYLGQQRVRDRDALFRSLQRQAACDLGGRIQRPPTRSSTATTSLPFSTRFPARRSTQEAARVPILSS